MKRDTWRGLLALAWMAGMVGLGWFGGWPGVGAQAALALAVFVSAQAAKE